MKQVVNITLVKFVPKRKRGLRSTLSIKIFNTLNTLDVKQIVAINAPGKNGSTVHSYVNSVRRMLLPKVFHSTIRDDTVYVQRMS